MTEGMMTRARAVDDQLSSITDQLARHDSIFSKIDSLCSTVQQHSESFDLLKKNHAESFDILRSSLAAQQSVMAEMMVKLQHLDRASSTSSPTLPSNQPPLLPLPPSHPISPLQSSSLLLPPSIHLNSSGSAIRPPKIEIQFFNGEDVPGWLFQINHYFLFHQIPADQRLAIAAFYMAGAARQWFQWLLSTDQLTTWDEFVRKLELRFGPSSFFNHEASLFKLKKSTTVAAFLHDFECLSTRVTDLSQRSLLNCFLSGLREDIQRELYILKPSDLHDAVGMAKLVEDKFAAARLYTARQTFPRPAVVHTPPPAHRPSPLPIKRLTPAEMAAR
ncbi:Retrotransposon gag domain-containing protein [Dioscorea alata]|uniref:Retrotransposon gag domain-containing protein n=1 Tax=Dioscorea alata TaxID=55571 RepID=A0ACB7VHI8_DIOAL|nr:Retrotransposon gag domain-containing protein [Dioscorea alata]